MKKTITAFVLLLVFFFIGCGKTGFTEEVVEAAIEKAGPYDVDASIDEDNNVRVSLNKFTKDIDEWDSEEEAYFYFMNVCIGAVGALAKDVAKQFSNLEIEVENDVLAFSLELCTDLAEAVMQETQDEEELGAIILEVFNTQLGLEEMITYDSPFQDVQVTLHPAGTAYDVMVKLVKASRTDATWNSFDDEEKFGYFAGYTSAMVGGSAHDISMELDDLLLAYEDEIWSIPVEHCTEITIKSMSGEMSDEELGTALFKKLKKVR
ncbi:hypothetical protein JXM67_11660 [candidate division WOR-3 bacterium]|nr:hypothetical protein [candidate division WOR-3 bacterium]